VRVPSFWYQDTFFKDPLRHELEKDGGTTEKEKRTGASILHSPITDAIFSWQTKGGLLLPERPLTINDIYSVQDDASANHSRPVAIGADTAKCRKVVPKAKELEREKRREGRLFDSFMSTR
jgi:hypothetical protein